MKNLENRMGFIGAGTSRIESLDRETLEERYFITSSFSPAIMPTTAYNGRSNYERISENLKAVFKAVEKAVYK